MLKPHQLMQYVGQAIVIICALYLGGRRMLAGRDLLVMISVIMISLVILDQFAPEVAQGMRRGTGFTIGTQITDGFTDGNIVTEDDDEDDTGDGTSTDNVPIPANLVPMMARYGTETIARQQVVGDKPVIAHPHLDRMGDDHRLFVMKAHEEHKHRMDKQADKEGFQAIVGQTAAELGLVFGQAPISEKGHSSRASDFLYSGDLIDLKTSTGLSILLPANARFVTLSSSGLLNKLRAVLSSGHANDVLKPIKYGDAVKLTYSGDRGETKYLSHQQWLQPAVSRKNQLFKFVNPLDVKSTGPIQVGDIIALGKINETSDPSMLVFDESSGRISTEGHLKEAVQFKVNSVRGCGPMWRFDSDTRGTNLKNPKQVKSIVDVQTRQIKQQLKDLEAEYGKLSAKCKLQCQQELLKAKHTQSSSNAMSSQNIASQGQLSALQQQVQSLKNNLSILKQYKKLLDHKYPVEQTCTAKGCGYNYMYDGQCVIGANNQQECDQIATQDCHKGKKLTWAAEGRGLCRVTPIV